MSDRDLATRINCTVDIGAYEYPAGACPGDIVAAWGVVDTDDMLALLGAWGNCTAPDPDPSCFGNIYPTACGSGTPGTVDTDDLLLLLGNWGACSESLMGGGGESESQGGESTSIADCMAAAEENGLEGDEFIAFLYECLCASGVIECDE